MPTEPRLHLPYQRWPAADRALWQAAFCQDDPFVEKYDRRLAKASIDRCMWAYRRFLGFAAIHEPAALKLAPDQRLTRERVRSLATHLAETNAPRSVASTVQALYQAADRMMPGIDWGWLRTIKARLEAAAPVVSPSGPEIISLQLLEIGERLMAKSRPPPGTAISRQQAVDYRNGVMFAFVAFVPFRPRNLVALELDRQLIRNGDDWFVFVPGDETKTETPLNFKIPELLASYLIFYIDVVRPKLLGGAKCTAVWVSRDGAAALSYVGLVKAFQSVSKHFNLPVAPHDARDAAATTWAVAAPESIGVAVDLLGHRGPRMMRHYNRAKGIEASRAYRNMLAELRKQSAKTNRAANETTNVDAVSPLRLIIDVQLSRLLR